MRVALICPNPPKPSLAIEHERRIAALIGTLKRFSLNTTILCRHDLPSTLDDYDWVIAAGGDGTILDTAWRCNDAPLSGVRLFPELSVGFLADVDPDRFEDFLRQILDGLGIERKVHRLQALVDGKALPHAILNDILFCNANPARATKYRLTYADTTQNQCSSGLWISTAAGSHAAIASYGLEKLPIDAHAYLFAVRELCHFGPGANDKTLPAIKSGQFLTATSPIIIPRGNGNAIYADGDMWQHPIQAGQALSFGEHPKLLKKWGVQP